MARRRRLNISKQLWARVAAVVFFLALGGVAVFYAMQGRGTQSDPQNEVSQHDQDEGVMTQTVPEVPYGGEEVDPDIPAGSNSLANQPPRLNDGTAVGANTNGSDSTNLLPQMTPGENRVASNDLPEPPEFMGSSQQFKPTVSSKPESDVSQLTAHLAKLFSDSSGFEFSTARPGPKRRVGQWQLGTQ